MKFKPNEGILRIALIVFSVLFGLLSISLISLGIVYVDELWWPRRYVGLDFLELPTMIIVLGSLSLVMSIAGCYCAKSYNRKLLISYAAILLTILCLELTISIIAFVNFNRHEEGKSKTAKIMWQQYNSLKEEDKIIFQEIEKHYDCCGVTGSEENCLNNATTTESPLYKPPIKGCATTVDQNIQAIALEAGYFTAILAVLQSVEIGYVILIQHFMYSK